MNRAKSVSTLCRMVVGADRSTHTPGCSMLALRSWLKHPAGRLARTRWSIPALSVRILSGEGQLLEKVRTMMKAELVEKTGWSVGTVRALVRLFDGDWERGLAARYKWRSKEAGTRQRPWSFSTSRLDVRSCVSGAVRGLWLYPDASGRRRPCASHGPVARFDGCDSPGDPTPVPSSSRATPHGTVRSPAPRPPVTECRWCVRDPFGLTDCLVRWSPAFRPRARGKICNLARRGALSARDGPRPSVEGARHCPSDHGGKREATLMIHVVHQRRPSRSFRRAVWTDRRRARVKTKWLVPMSRWFLRLPG